MILPPLVLSHPHPGRIEAELTLTADAPAFAGHFPGQPVLPGVVQLEWAMHLAARHFGLAQRAAQDFQVKFRRAIQPGHRLRLILELDRAKGRLDFEFRLDDETASLGRVKLETLP